MADGGRILNVSSGLTRIIHPGYGAYAIMKTAVEALTLYLAKELGPRRIAVNTLAPGAIETDFRGGAVRDNKDVNAQIAAITALGRVGLPDDIGGVCRGHSGRRGRMDQWSADRSIRRAGYLNNPPGKGLFIKCPFLVSFPVPGVNRLDWQLDRQVPEPIICHPSLTLSSEKISVSCSDGGQPVAPCARGVCGYSLG